MQIRFFDGHPLDQLYKPLMDELQIRIRDVRLSRAFVALRPSRYNPRVTLIGLVLSLAMLYRPNKIRGRPLAGKPLLPP
jgi:hypothetical protein